MTNRSDRLFTVTTTAGGFIAHGRDARHVLRRFAAMGHTVLAIRPRALTPDIPDNNWTRA